MILSMRESVPNCTQKVMKLFLPPCDLDSDKVAEILTDCEGYILGGDEIANAQLLNKPVICG